jgi:hypothetical protein
MGFKDKTRYTADEALRLINDDLGPVMYHRVCGPQKMRSPLATQDDVAAEAQRCYGERGQVEGYTDEVHVYRVRRDGKRRDFVASYQVE